MNIRESLTAGRENVETTDWLVAISLFVLMLTFGNLLMMLYVFHDQLTAAQLRGVGAFVEVGVLIGFGLPAVTFLSGFAKAFELRSSDGENDNGEDSPDAPDTEGDKVRFEATAEVDADAQEGGE